jgi:cell division protein FtsL
MSIEVEYAIKKDVRNNPIVREVDLAQRQEFRRNVWLGVLVVATLLFSAWQHYEVVQGNIQIENVRRQLLTERSENRQLRVEHESLLAPALLEKRAVDELHMVAPSPNDIVVFERVPATTARQGIVAALRR